MTREREGLEFLFENQGDLYPGACWQADICNQESNATGAGLELPQSFFGGGRFNHVMVFEVCRMNFMIAPLGNDVRAETGD